MLTKQKNMLRPPIDKICNHLVANLIVWIMYRNKIPLVIYFEYLLKITFAYKFNINIQNYNKLYRIF